MNSSTSTVGKWHITFALFALCAMILAPFAEVKAQAASQGVLTVQKTIVGTTTVSANDFSFLIDGASSTNFEADGSNNMLLSAGTYDITEVPATGFVTTYSAGCNNTVITAGATTTCTITNTASSSSGSLDPGTLVINKVIIGTTTVSATAFTFDVMRNLVTPMVTNEPFEADGTNVYDAITGLYTITEDSESGFATTYSNSLNGDADCEALLVTANATTTCTVTNTVTGVGETTGTLLIQKRVIGGSLATSSFSFKVNGGATSTFQADGSNRMGNLATGTYSIIENPSHNYTPSYSNCTGVSVTAGATTTCTITNTFNNGNPQTTGTLLVRKIVNGGNGATSSFSFLINGAATTTVEVDGMNRFGSMATGSYSITEVPTANYTPTYNNCANAVVTAGATTTCTITNNFNVGGQTLYTIDGYKWNDADADGVWDNGESALQGWMISANATGQLVRTDVTDANGYYSLLVPAGTWMVIETQQSGWTQIFPSNNTGHSVMFSTTSTTTADLNFGNDQNQSSSGGGGGGGGGNGVRIELRDDNNDNDNDRNDDDSNDDNDTNDDDDDTSGGTGTTPDGQVLGAETSIFPYGAPNTGAGGGELQKMEENATIPLLSTVLLLLVGFGVARAMRDNEEEVI